MYIISNGGLPYFHKNTKESVLSSNFDHYSDGVLIDVRLTKDKRLVLYEDDLVYKDYYISQMNYQDVRKIKLFSKVRRYYIPLLEEILSKYHKEVLLIRLHHNYENNKELVDILREVLERYPKNNYLIMVNNDNLYEYAKSLDYPVYFENDKHFAFVNYRVINYNLTRMLNKKIANESSNNLYLITNNSKLSKSR